jgi:hypothetical protein
LKTLWCLCLMPVNHSSYWTDCWAIQTVCHNGSLDSVKFRNHSAKFYLSCLCKLSQRLKFCQLYSWTLFFYSPFYFLNGPFWRRFCLRRS